MRVKLSYANVSLYMTLSAI